MRNNLLITVMLWVVLPAIGLDSVQGATQFLYLSDQRIVTAEVADSTSVILNYINLTKTYEVLEARQLVLVGPGDVPFRGHLFQREGNDPEHPYDVSSLIKPNQFTGYVVLGWFDLNGAATQVLLEIGGRIVELEPVSPEDFELVAARIGEIDFEAKDKKSAILAAGFHRGFGNLVFKGSAEADAYERYFPESKVVAPVPLKTPRPRLPSSDGGLADPVVVSVKAVVSKTGGLKGVEALAGPNERLQKIAVETVRNSWVFLPAISDKQLAEAELKLSVKFQR